MITYISEQFSSGGVNSRSGKGSNRAPRLCFFLFDRRVTLSLLCFTQLIRAGFCLNMLLCHPRLFPRLSLPWGCVWNFF